MNVVFCLHNIHPGVSKSSFKTIRIIEVYYRCLFLKKAIHNFILFDIENKKSIIALHSADIYS